MNPIKCSVCSDPETKTNRFLECKSCWVSVHMMCYGVENYGDDWICSPCKLYRKEPTCSLCHQKSGAMKKTLCEKWVHVICALFTEGVVFVDENEMEPIDISKISSSKRNKICMFCKEAIGFCCRCSKSSCGNRLHITCAQGNNCLKEEHKSDSTIKFRAFCLDHKPKESSRRISSNFVRDQISKTKGRKVHKMQSNQLNSNWITQRKTKIVEQPQSSNANIQPIVASSEHQEGKKNEHCDQNIGDSKIEHNKKTSIGLKLDQHFQKDVDSVQMWWDTRDLRAENQFIDSFSSKENAIIEDHICFKDDKIVKLKEKIKKLKSQKAKLEELNMQLQEQALQHDHSTLLSNAELKANEKVLKKLQKRLNGAHSDDKTEFVFENGVKVSAEKMKILETISTDASADRLFINSYFFIVFSEKYIKKQIKKGLNRANILTKFRDSNRYQIMKDAYDYRVLSDGKGDIPSRLRVFKTTFRTKLNNWWISNASKIHSGSQA